MMATQQTEMDAVQLVLSKQTGNALSVTPQQPVYEQISEEMASLSTLKLIIVMMETR